ncbi:MAG TPA: apolipoprotein N-acyltransferase [Verrucomicrobiota bacterium]|nr:apolipoprotein N-acyltransferase [Verrucomicrobiota bacterium]
MNVEQTANPPSVARLSERFYRASPWLLAGLSGVLAALAFPLPGWSVLAWLAPGLLWVTSLGKTGGQSFRLGYVSGLVQFLISLRWLLNIPFPSGAIAAWLALSGYCALFFGAWLWVAGVGFRVITGGTMPGNWNAAAKVVAESSWIRRFFLWLGIAVSWAGLEFMRGWFLSGFPWNFYGVTQWENAPLIQVAAVTGVFGVSFLVCWVSVALFGALLSVRRPGGNRWAWTADLRIPLIVLLIVLGIGFRRLMQAPDPGPPVRLALVQPSIPQTLIWDDEANPARFAKVFDLTRAALSARPDALIWPEGSMPDLTDEQFTAVTNETQRARAWWILGTGYGRLVDGRPEHYNAALLVNPAGRVVDRYHKRRLVIFGEFIPFENTLPFMKWLTPIGSSFTPGRGPAAFRFGPATNTVASPVICFEDMFPDSTRAHVTPETDFLVELTNNGWFGESSAHWQHCAGAAFRAVENGVPLVRCANNGLTCWLDEFGRLRDLLGRHGAEYAPGVLITQVPQRPDGAPRSLTFYHRYGDVFGWSCLAITAVLAGIGCRRARS